MFTIPFPLPSLSPPLSPLSLPLSPLSLFLPPSLSPPSLKAIHEKIQALGLQQVYTRIRQVDSNSTVHSNEKDHAILIQVTGELSNAGQAMRPFVQTFVLALESPKKYYIHNDIFRYQIYDEDFVSETDDTNEVQIETEPITDGNSAELAPSTDHAHTDEGGDDAVSESSVKGSPAPPVATEVLPTTNSWSDHYEGIK